MVPSVLHVTLINSSTRPERRSASPTGHCHSQDPASSAVASTLCSELVRLSISGTFYRSAPLAPAGYALRRVRRYSVRVGDRVVRGACPACASARHMGVMAHERTGQPQRCHQLTVCSTHVTTTGWHQKCTVRLPRIASTLVSRTFMAHAHTRLADYSARAQSRLHRHRPPR